MISTAKVGRYNLYDDGGSREDAAGDSGTSEAESRHVQAHVLHPHLHPRIPICALLEISQTHCETPMSRRRRQPSHQPHTDASLITRPAATRRRKQGSRWHSAPPANISVQMSTRSSQPSDVIHKYISILLLIHDRGCPVSLSISPWSMQSMYARRASRHRGPRIKVGPASRGRSAHTPTPRRRAADRRTTA